MDARAVVCAVSLTLLCAPAADAATVKGAAGSTFAQSPGRRGGALPERHVFAIRAAKRRR
jgi:hypothetical protein